MQLVGACVRSNPDDALPPVLTAVTPHKATVGSVGRSITLSGENFVPRTIVQLDGAPLATTFVSSTELRATIQQVTLIMLGITSIWLASKLFAHPHEF